MTETGDSLPKDFIRITDPAEEEILFREGLRTQATALLWSTGKRHVLKTKLNSRRPNKEGFTAKVPLGVEPSQLALEMAGSGLIDFYFSVSLSKANILFKSFYLGANSEGLHFRNPEKLYKVQRRKNMRLQIREGYVLKVTYLDPADTWERVTRKVFDLSAGGIAILVNADEAPRYVSEATIREMTFTVRQRQITVNGKVRYCRQVPQHGFKAGVIFEGMSPADAAHIEDYVLEENTRLMSRFL